MMLDGDELLAAIQRSWLAPAVFGLIPFGQDNGSTANRHYLIPHADELDLNSTTGWAWACFTNISALTAPNRPYLLSSGGYKARPSANFWCTNSSQTPANAYSITVSDLDSDHEAFDDDTVTLDQLRLAVFQFNPVTGNLEIYTCDPGQAASLVSSVAGPGSVVAPTDWFFGARSDLNSDRFWTARAGGLWKAGRALTPAEIASIAAGASPATVLGDGLAGWWPFKDGPVAVELDRSGNGNDATRQGTWP